MSGLGGGRSARLSIRNSRRGRVQRDQTSKRCPRRSPQANPGRHHNRRTNKGAAVEFEQPRWNCDVPPAAMSGYPFMQAIVEQWVTTSPAASLIPPNTSSPRSAVHVILTKPGGNEITATLDRRSSAAVSHRSCSATLVRRAQNWPASVTSSSVLRGDRNAVWKSSGSLKTEMVLPGMVQRRDTCSSCGVPMQFWHAASVIERARAVGTMLMRCCAQRQSVRRRTCSPKIFWSSGHVPKLHSETWHRGLIPLMTVAALRGSLHPPR